VPGVRNFLSKNFTWGATNVPFFETSLGCYQPYAQADFPPEFFRNQLALSYAAPFLFCR
jgi:hypothetical protein